MQNYQKIISAWHLKAISEEDPFTAFIFEYLAFTSLLRLQNTTSAHRDRDLIDNCKRDPRTKRVYLEIINSNESLKKIWDEIVSALKIQPLVKVTPGTSHWVGPEGIIQESSDWPNVIEFWYRIRNNLFHGHKNPESQRDLQLVTLGFKTLSPLVAHLL